MSVINSSTPKSAPSTASRPGTSQPAPSSSSSSNTSPQDTVSLSSSVGKTEKSTTGNAQDATSPVDPQRQDDEVPDQERRIEDQKASATDDAGRDAAEALRPATGDDAERYNNLVAEADSYEPGSYDTENGQVEVSDENGVKTLRYQEGDTQRIVTVDSNTGSVSEMVNRRIGNSTARDVDQSVDYHREGDTLAPVVDQRKQASLQFENLQQAIQSPEFQAQLEENRQQQLLELQNRIDEARNRPQPSFNDYLRG